MESTVHQRKIELQSSEDFTYLINNVRRAAADSINAAFPPVEGTDGQGDELRIQIEQLVNEVCVKCVPYQSSMFSRGGHCVVHHRPFPPPSQQQQINDQVTLTPVFHHST